MMDFCYEGGKALGFIAKTNSLSVWTYHSLKNVHHGMMLH